MPSSSTSADTRARLITAALDTLRTKGITGASARTVAAAAGVNQASIYYHFGSVHDLLLAACEALAQERVTMYRDRLEGIRSLPELVEIARELHAQDIADGNVVVLTQVLAGMGGDDDLGPRAMSIFQPWIDVVHTAVQRVLAGTPFDDLLDTEQLSYAVSAMFLGIGLLTHLGDRRALDGTLFAALDDLAEMGDELLNTSTVATSMFRRRVVRRRSR